MNINKPKLIIWDFDGVIADTEILWLENRKKLLKEKFGINWNTEEANNYIGGMSDETKRKVLDNLGIKTDDRFWRDTMKLDYEIMNKGFELTPDIEDIFKIKGVKQCIATGGIWTKSLDKIKIVKIGQYFNEQNLFTADLVKYGKPEPDLFLLACEKMGVEPNEAIVIEDSIAGLTAAIKANIIPIAFVGSKMNNNQEYIQKVKKLGVAHIFDNMKDLKEFISHL